MSAPSPLNKDGRVDIEKARRLGKLHLIREYRVDTEVRKVDAPFQRRANDHVRTPVAPN